MADFLESLFSGVMMTFAVKLRELREAKGWTQKRLADQAGMSLGGLTKLEQGINKPSWEGVQALSKALGVSCEAFDVPEGDDGQADRESPSPRKPGRPRKPVAEEVGPAPKRPRGRPKKEK